MGILNRKGQVTIPKKVRDAMNLVPGSLVDFAVNGEGGLVIRKVEACNSEDLDRFETAKGRADVQWKTKDLMALLRG